MPARRATRPEMLARHLRQRDFVAAIQDLNSFEHPEGFEEVCGALQQLLEDLISAQESLEVAVENGELAEAEDALDALLDDHED